MNNEHNPIYRKVEKLRAFWVEETEKQPGYKLARWLMIPDDIDLLIGLLKLESSPHGQLSEVFIVMISAFAAQETFSHDLVRDWIHMYKLEKEKFPEHDFSWDYSLFEDKLKALGTTRVADDLLIEMLNSFKKYINDDRRFLVFGLIPQSVTSFSAYNLWLDKVLQDYRLAEGVKIMVLDHTGKGYLNEVCRKQKDRVLTLDPGDMDIHSAVKAVATQGNPRDPQVQMRKCIFEMSDAISKNDKPRLYKWGEEVIRVGQRSGQKSLFASVHLVYAGFLMQFREIDKIDDLLERGIKIAKSALPAQTDCIPVLIQLYAFKGSNYALAKDFEKSIDWYTRQAKLCTENEMPAIAISAYKTAVFLAEKDHLKELYRKCAEAGYDLGKEMKDDEVKQTDYSFLAFHYYLILKEMQDPAANAVRNRMMKIYGAGWEESSEKEVQQMKSKKPIESE
jgi:hypothetical protein